MIKRLPVLLPCSPGICPSHPRARRFLAEHEVWHNGSSDRVVLLLDVWHPDLDPLEIAAVQGMFSDAKAKGWIT